MLAKISIIAGKEKTVSSCVELYRRLHAHHWLVAKLPITIKHFRSAERVYNLKKYVRCGRLKSIGLHHSLLWAIDEIKEDRNRGIAWTRRLSELMMWSVYERLSEPPTVTEEGRKPENLAFESNDDHSIALDEQLQEELPISELLLEQNHTEMLYTTRKAVHKLVRDTYRVLSFDLLSEKDKDDTSDMKHQNFPQLIKHPGRAQ